jgi:hypothetical protein
MLRFGFSRVCKAFRNVLLNSLILFFLLLNIVMSTKPLLLGNARLMIPQTPSFSISLDYCSRLRMPNKRYYSSILNYDESVCLLPNRQIIKNYRSYWLLF